LVGHFIPPRWVAQAALGVRKNPPILGVAPSYCTMCACDDCQDKASI
jgi:hypothetical protein